VTQANRASVPVFGRPSVRCPSFQCCHCWR
jgi:hypothetical protein